MKKLILVSMILVLVGSLVVGCASTPTTATQTQAAVTSTTSTASSTKPAWNWPSSITITTPATGGSPNVATLTWAPMLEQSTGCKVRVLPEGTSALTRQWLKDGKYDFFVETQAVNGGTWFAAKYADATRDGGPFPLRVVWMASLQNMALMTQGDSAIKTIYDLKPGAHFAQFTGAKSTTDVVLGLIAWLKLENKAVIVPFGSWTANHLSISDGSADIAFGHTDNAAAVQVGAGPHGLRWVDLPAATDPEGAKRFLQVVNLWPFSPVTVGMQSAQGVQGLLSPFYIYAREDTDPVLVYNLCKWLDTNYAKYAAKNIVCEPMGVKTFRSVLDFNYLPVQQGTINYLKDTGVWTAKDDSNQKDNVALLVKWQDTYKAAIAEADKQKIEVDPTNAKWIELLNTFIQPLPRIGVKIQ